MTIQGRTSPRWGRDKSARWDSNPDNGFRTRSYPSVTQKEPGHFQSISTRLHGRPGYAERDISLTKTDDELTVRLSGWYDTTVDLNARQIAFLRDTLNDWFPRERDNVVPPGITPPYDPAS